MSYNHGTLIETTALAVPLMNSILALGEYPLHPAYLLLSATTSAYEGYPINMENYTKQRYYLPVQLYQVVLRPSWSIWLAGSLTKVLVDHGASSPR